MAECSYARCLQERRNIKRELLKWSKDMVHVVGLERIAEELMGRRKWKLFQENLSRSQTNTNPDHFNLEHTHIGNLEPSIVENHISEKKEFIIKNEAKDKLENNIRLKLENNITENPNSLNKTIKPEVNSIDKKTTETSSSPSSTSTLLLNLLDKPPPKPIDWKPSDKCYFCVDGKLLTVNDKGELVAESGSALPEAELANRSTVDSDSGDSRNSTPDILRSQSLVNVKKLKASQQQQQHRDSQHPPQMTSLESMAARLAAVASIHPGLQPGLGQLGQLRQLGQLYPNLYYQPFAQILPPAAATTAETPLPSISPSNKDSPSPHETITPVGGEQPLDLSAKPLFNSPSSASGDSKSTSVRPKPRLNPNVPVRRAYTEEELRNALQDIMSGKLGTRKAACVYGIPRSTLRNKVNKITLEQKRETSTPSSIHLLDAEDDDNDNENDNDGDQIGLSDDENSESDKLMESSFISDHEHQQQQQQQAPLLFVQQKHRKLNNSFGGAASSSDEQIKPSTPSPSTTTSAKLTAGTPGISVQNKNITPQPSPTPPVGPNWLDPNFILQTLLLSNSFTGNNSSAAGAIANLASLFTPNTDDPAAIRDLLNVLKLQQEELIKKLSNDTGNREGLNNGKPMMDSMQLMQNLKQQNQQLGQMQHHHHQARMPKSDTPDTGSSLDINETNEDGVILKIPSFKPVVPASSSSTTSSMKSCDQNEISPLSVSTHHSIAPMLSRSPHQSNNLSAISPSLRRQSSESQSPPDVSMREIIANSLNRFNQQNIKDNHLGKSSHHYSMNDLSEQYGKRPGISVIKNIGGTDLSKFANTPNLLNNYQNAANQCAAGKGTRPKRGKYRNYDRDSLTEAVKAVQRGEMSVHRAGSYYGVPHSTLEYKVKERHLMRPRKREPKPQPLDGGTNCSSTTSSSTSSKLSNIPGLTAVNNADKMQKTSMNHQQQKSAMKPNQQLAFPNTSPNGMKVPIFDPVTQLQYAAPHLFWPHSAAAAAGFTGLPLEFPSPSRATSTGPGNGSSGNSTATSPGQQQNPFSPNTDSFLATQMIQRFHEESRLNAGSNNNSSKSPSLAGSNANLNNISSNSINSNNNNISSSNVPLKTAREIAQNLYDSGSANGSFLDDIIRQTLDRKSNNDVPHGALFDQLIKNTKPQLLSSASTLSGSTPSSSSSSSEMHSHALVNALTSNKRSASPNSYPVINIKRERSSSPLPNTSIGLLGNMGNNLKRDHDLHHHSMRSSLNDDTDLSSDVRTSKHHHQRESSSSADSLIKARLEGIMIKTETNDHHQQHLHHNSPSSSDMFSQRHHTNSQSVTSSGGSILNSTTNSTRSANISHSTAAEDLNGNNTGEIVGTGSNNLNKTDNELILNNDSRGNANNNIISSEDLILKSKLGFIKSETDENL